MITAVVRSTLGIVAAAAEFRAAGIVEVTAANIEAGAKLRSRVDTGQMRAGWETIEEGPLARRVQNPVEHTIYNEYGTVYMSAQPMLAPSVEEQTEPFLTSLRQVFQ
jgi:hypothetical protein